MLVFKQDFVCGVGTKFLFWITNMTNYHLFYVKIAIWKWIVHYFSSYSNEPSIRYAKENGREKRERKKGRRRDIEREGEIREREGERGERDKERESERERHREREWREEEGEEEKIEYLSLKEKVKSLENLPNGEIKRKSPVLHKLSCVIITQNYL